MRNDLVLIGWDVGGAHVKASCWRAGRLQDVRQWACPLWQGLHHLDPVLHAAAQAWGPLLQARHVVTMSGEMTDLFADREAGVQQIALHLQAACGAALQLYAGASGWVGADEVAVHWPAIASANWLATASYAAQHCEGLLVDIGSTTTDLIVLRGGAVQAQGRSDAERLVSGELVYHGVVRTPLCAVAPRVPFRGRNHRVMNEWFATSADVYRLLGQLDPAHDLYPAADNGSKDAAGTCRRLARMIGLDGRDAALADWHQLAQAWADAQLDEIETAALLQRLAAVRGRLSLCADQAAAAKWWLSMPMASVSAEGPMPKALSTRRTSPLMPGCRHQGRACPLRRARMTSNPLIVA
jgi:probable H4MPT-linked C1 transfer pathway protein